MKKISNPQIMFNGFDGLRMGMLIDKKKKKTEIADTRSWAPENMHLLKQLRIKQRILIGDVKENQEREQRAEREIKIFDEK